MFTEGLDESSINWIKQGSIKEKQLQRSPLSETLVPCTSIRDRSSVMSNAVLSSPNKLPPLKFNSGFLGIQTTGFDLDDFSEENDGVGDESVGSTTSDHRINMDTSDSFDEECLETTYDSDFFRNPCTVSCDDEIKSEIHNKSNNCRPTLIRSKSKQNLKVEVGDITDGCQKSTSFLNTFTGGEVGPPSAPPITMNGRWMEDSKDFGVDEHLINQINSFSISEPKLFDDPNTKLERMNQSNDRCIDNAKSEHVNVFAQTSMDHMQCYNVSGQSAWQTFVAYDACFRLCLNAWARDCMEAPEFLKDECNVLRNAFGIQKYLLQPRDHQSTKEKHADFSEETCTRKGKNVIRKIKVEVRKIRIIPQKKFQNTHSLGSLYASVGAQYVQTVSEMLKTKINSLKDSSFSCPQEETTMSCYIQLKSSTMEKQKDPDSIIRFQPGNGDSYIFYPESQSDALIVQVHLKRSSSVQCQTIIHISSLTEDYDIDKLQWWPLYLADNECIGKIQLSISCSNNSNKIRPIKNDGPVVETFVYDLVLEAAMRAQNFHSRNLHICGSWKWLLNEFSSYYDVSNTYTKLRYISFIMNVATPTKDCLELVYELLLSVIEDRNKKNLNRQEGSLLLDCEAQVENLLATCFENYKSIDGLSPSGLGDLHCPIPEFATPGLLPAVQIYTLLHDILSQEAQSLLRKYLQTAAVKRCKRHMLETDEFVTSNSDVITDSINISTAYLKMKSLCKNISREIQADIKIHNQHILPSSIDLPNITAVIYSNHLCRRLRGFLKACPPSKPSQHVIELLTTTACFERDLHSWNISLIQGGVIARDLFHDYILLWIEDMRLHLLELCKVEKVSWLTTSAHYSTSPFVENMYDQIKVALSEYELIIKRWPQYLSNLETVVSDIERAILKTIEKQFAEILLPLRDSIPQKLEKHVQKLENHVQKLTRRRQSVLIYIVPDQLGTFVNTIKRILDVLHGRIENMMKSQALSLTGDNKTVYGEQMNGIVVLLRKKYKNYIQAIVEKLITNVQANRSTKLKQILEDTKDVDGEADVRERMQVLCLQISDSICKLHSVFSSRVFVTICRGFWDKMGQIVLKFLESRKENRIWYKASQYSLTVLDDIFASQMQTLLGHSLQEKDLDPPRSVIEAWSILC